MSIQSALSKPQLSYYLLGAAFVANYIPHAYMRLVAFKGGNWDNKDPRNNAEKVATKLKAEELAVLRRANAAEQNSHEIFPLIAVSILAATVARVPAYTVNKYAAIFLTLRLIYNPLYIFAGSNDRIAAARSITWNAAMFTCLRLIKLAADNASKVVEEVLVVVT